MISARIDTAISAGVRLPRCRPIGPCRRSISSRRQVEHRQPLLALGGVDARAQRADVERRRLQRLEQHHVVELRIVRDGHHGAVRVELQLEHHVVGHRLGEVVPGTSQVRWYSSRGSQQMTSKSSASAICASTRDSWPAPMIEQPPARAEHGAQHAAVEREGLAASRPARRSTAPVSRSSGARPVRGARCAREPRRSMRCRAAAPAPGAGCRRTAGRSAPPLPW